MRASDTYDGFVNVSVSWAHHNRPEGTTKNLYEIVSFQDSLWKRYKLVFDTISRDSPTPQVETPVISVISGLFCLEQEHVAVVRCEISTATESACRDDLGIFEKASPRVTIRRKAFERPSKCYKGVAVPSQIQLCRSGSSCQKSLPSFPGRLSTHLFFPQAQRSQVDCAFQTSHETVFEGNEMISWFT